MKMIDEKFEDINGRKYRLYTVRSIGPGQRFGVIDRYRNTVVAHPFPTREEAWDYVKTQEAA